MRAEGNTEMKKVEIELKDDSDNDTVIVSSNSSGADSQNIFAV